MAIVSNVRLNIWQFTRTSWHIEVTRYYAEFPECLEIKCMCKQRIHQAFFSDYSNGPGYEAKNNYVSNSDGERMRKSWCSIFYPQFQIEVQATMHTIVSWSATGWSTLCVHLTHKVANRKHSFKYSGLLLYLAHYAMLFWTSTMNSKMPWSANSKYAWCKIEPLALESIPDCNQHHKWQ